MRAAARSPGSSPAASAAAAAPTPARPATFSHRWRAQQRRHDLHAHRAPTRHEIELQLDAGLETTSVDRNGLEPIDLPAYSGDLLEKITDPLGNATTLSYSSGVLSTIEDPAGRTATFTMSSGELTAVQYANDSTWDYGYTSGQLTSVTEPSSAGEPTKITDGVPYDRWLIVSARLRSPMARRKSSRRPKPRAGLTAARRAARRLRSCWARLARPLPIRSAT